MKIFWSAFYLLIDIVKMTFLVSMGFLLGIRATLAPDLANSMSVIIPNLQNCIMASLAIYVALVVVEVSVEYLQNRHKKQQIAAPNIA